MLVMFGNIGNIANICNIANIGHIGNIVYSKKVRKVFPEMLVGKFF